MQLKFFFEQTPAKLRLQCSSSVLMRVIRHRQHLVQRKASKRGTDQGTPYPTFSRDGTCPSLFS